MHPIIFLAAHLMLRFVAAVPALPSLNGSMAQAPNISVCRCGRVTRICGEIGERHCFYAVLPRVFLSDVHLTYDVYCAPRQNQPSATRNTGHFIGRVGWDRTISWTLKMKPSSALGHCTISSLRANIVGIRTRPNGISARGHGGIRGNCFSLVLMFRSRVHCGETRSCHW